MKVPEKSPSSKNVSAHSSSKATVVKSSYFWDISTRGVKQQRMNLFVADFQKFNVTLGATKVLETKFRR